MESCENKFICTAAFYSKARQGEDTFRLLDDSGRVGKMTLEERMDIMNKRDTLLHWNNFMETSFFLC